MSLPPKNLAIFYGWPSTVNGAGGNVATTVAEFSVYDHVIFGAGLEDPNHPDYANTLAIISDPGMSSVEKSGYISAQLSLDDIQDKIDRWATVGVTHIFMDEFGYDFNISREKQRAIVWCVHCKNLKAFVNAWNVDDVFSSAVDPANNPNGKPTRLGTDDIYLAESWQIVNDEYDTNVAAWKSKADKMLAAKNDFGVKLACTTTSVSDSFDQAKWDYAYFSAVLYGLDYASYGENNFAASTSQMPFRERKPFLGTSRTGDINTSGSAMEVQLNVGIHINTTTYEVKQILDLV